MKTVINHFIPKGKEGTYYTIPFEMPGDIDTAFVHYEYADGVVDLGIQEEERFLGWSGSNKKTISFGNQAEKGYLSSRLKAGTYYIMVGAYKIPEEGVTVTYTIDFIPKEEKWLSGDIHVHSTASDGQYDTYTLAQKAKSIGLDFLSITDHNNFSENFYLPHVDGVTMILGVEWTHYRGHMNIYGIKDPFDDFVLNSESEMEAFIQKVRARGAVVSVNHPKDRSCPYLWESQSYDLFEIWNGPMRPCNVKALQMWHELLCSGKRVPIVGGSDFHRSVHPVFLGHPITRVLAKSNTPEDIMAALLAGKSYVTCSRNGPAIDLRHEDGVLNITVANARGCTIRLMTNKGVGAQFRNQATISVDPSWDFAYVVVKSIRIKAISNPVYFN